MINHRSGDRNRQDHGRYHAIRMEEWNGGDPDLFTKAQTGNPFLNLARIGRQITVQSDSAL